MGKRAEEIQAAVLAELRARRLPASAYAILEALKPQDDRLAPTSIYRALTALIEQGAVHRLESQNAFVACRGDCRHQDAILSICGCCGVVTESSSEDVSAALIDAARRTGFAPSRHVIEVLGRCAACGAGEPRW